MAKLECIVICVNFDDYLRITYPYNKKYFDKYIVVTDSQDKDTQQFCAENDIHCVITDVFYENGDCFNKGKGINVGFAELEYHDWVIHLDADMIIDHNFINTKLDLDNLDKKKLYAPKHRSSSKNEYVDNWHRKYQPVEFKSNYQEALGYFQMFHVDKFNDTNNKQWYPEMCPTCELSDLLFANQFKHVVFIPNFTCIHLGIPRLFWYGRGPKNDIMEQILRSKHELEMLNHD